MAKVLKMRKPKKPPGNVPKSPNIVGGEVLLNDQKTMAICMAFLLASARHSGACALRVDTTRKAFIALDEHQVPLGAVAFRDVDGFTRWVHENAGGYDPLLMNAEGQA